MSDPLELELKLEWASRRLEEQEGLIRSLRASVESVLAQYEDAHSHNSTLKSVQEGLLREKIRAEEQVQVLLRERAELASENARLHVYARECAARAAAAAESMRAAAVANTFMEAEAGHHADSEAACDRAADHARGMNEFGLRVLVGRLLQLCHDNGVAVPSGLLADARATTSGPPGDGMPAGGHVAASYPDTYGSEHVNDGVIREEHVAHLSSIIGNAAAVNHDTLIGVPAAGQVETAAGQEQAGRIEEALMQNDGNHPTAGAAGSRAWTAIGATLWNVLLGDDGGPPSPTKQPQAASEASQTQPRGLDAPSP